MLKNIVKNFRLVNSIEGYSYIILLFVAMPMKYIWGFPLAVKIAGMTHGILFILFCLLLVEAWKKTNWSHKENALFFVASLVPFGTFYTKSRIKAYE